MKKFTDDKKSAKIRVGQAYNRRLLVIKIPVVIKSLI